MSDNKNKDSGTNPVVIGIAGALIGAAATASAMALSDEKNRQKLEKVVADLKVHGEKLLEVVQKEAGVVKDLTNGNDSKENKKAPAKRSAAKKPKTA